MMAKRRASDRDSMLPGHQAPRPIWTLITTATSASRARVPVNP